MCCIVIHLCSSQPPVIQVSVGKKNCCSLIDLYTGTQWIVHVSALSPSLICMFTHTVVVRWDPLIQQIKGLSSCPYYRCCWRGRRGCRGTRQGGGGKSWQIGGGQGRQGWSCRLFWKLPAAVSAIRIKPVPGGGGGSHCRFLSSQPVPVCLPAEWDDIREGDGGNVPPPHPLLNNSSACPGSLQVCGCSRAARLLMEPAITNTDILTFK